MKTKSLQLFLLMVAPLTSTSYCDEANPCEKPEVIAQLAHLCLSSSAPDFETKGSANCEAEVGLDDTASLKKIGGVCRSKGECLVFCRSECPDGEVAPCTDILNCSMTTPAPLNNECFCIDLLETSSLAYHVYISEGYS